MKISAKRVTVEPVTYTPEVLQITVEDQESLLALRIIASKMRVESWSVTCDGVTIEEDRIVSQFLKNTLGAL